MALTSQKNNTSSYVEVFPINLLPLLINYHLFRETQKVILGSIFFFYHFYSQQGSFPDLGLSKTKSLSEIPVKYINILEISTVCHFQAFLAWAAYARSINLPWLYEGWKPAPKPLAWSLCLKMKLIIIDYTGPQRLLDTICFFMTARIQEMILWSWNVFSAIITSSCADSTHSLLAHEDWTQQLCEWPRLHSSLLCSAPVEMQPRERIWKAERQTPSSWDHCLGINPEWHLHIQDP